MADVLHLNAEEFEEQLSKGDVLLVDFFADWCMPCKLMAPVVEKVAATFDGRATVAKINVDDEPELAERYGIQSIPALLLFHNSAPIDELIGARPYEEVAAAVEKLL